MNWKLFIALGLVVASTSARMQLARAAVLPPGDSVNLRAFSGNQ